MLNYWIGMAAICAFAMAGVLAAGRRGMDIIALLFMGVITAVGGGTLRDLLLGVPVFWMIDFNYVWVASAASLAAFTLDPWLVAWSLLGAVIVNLIIGVNHRKDRYVAR